MEKLVSRIIRAIKRSLEQIKRSLEQIKRSLEQFRAHTLNHGCAFGNHKPNPDVTLRGYLRRYSAVIWEKIERYCLSTEPSFKRGHVINIVNACGIEEKVKVVLNYRGTLISLKHFESLFQYLNIFLLSSNIFMYFDNVLEYLIQFIYVI